MAKYYVQSGTLRSVVDSDDVAKAALWAVHRTMQQIAPIFDDRSRTPGQKGQSVATDGLLVLDEQILVSEVGFDRQDAFRVETFQAILQWHQLMIALDRLEQLL